jgi:aspartyl/asparaginyl beta-hydroxylase (cupin superfamily)
MFFDPVQFGFTGALEQNWRAIRAEFEALGAAALTPWPERELYSHGWEVAGLYAFGRKLEENCARCPVAASMVTAIPGMTTAGFSVLQAGARILPHRGYTNEVLRCHLGLVVPAGCSMRVGGETRNWEEGRCLVFDDTVEHEVWHRGDSPRVVLLVDFARSGSARVMMPEVVAAALGGGA